MPRYIVLFFTLVTGIRGYEESVFVNGQRIDDPAVKQQIKQQLSNSGLYPSLQALTNPLAGGLNPSHGLLQSTLPHLYQPGLAAYGQQVPQYEDHPLVSQASQHHIILVGPHKTHNQGLFSQPPAVSTSEDSDDIPAPNSPFLRMFGFGRPDEEEQSPSFQQETELEEAKAPKPQALLLNPVANQGEKYAQGDSDIFKVIGRMFNKMHKSDASESDEQKPEEFEKTENEEQESGNEDQFEEETDTSAVTGTFEFGEHDFNYDIEPHTSAKTSQEVNCFRRKGCYDCTYDYKCFFCESSKRCLPAIGITDIFRGTTCPMSEVYYWKTCKVKSFTLVFFIGILLLSVFVVVFTLVFVLVHRRRRRAKAYQIIKETQETYDPGLADMTIE